MNLPDPGIYHDVPDGEYHAWPYASKSQLWRIHEMPGNLATVEQARAWLAHKADSYALVFGRAFDDYVCCPDVGVWAARYAVGPTKTPDTKAWLKTQQDAPNVALLTEDDYAAIPKMVESMLMHPVVGPLFTGEGVWQASIVWDDPATGTRCKGRVDRWATWRGTDNGPTRPVHVDIKTTRNADPRVFPYDAKRFGYHVQAAHYLDGADVIRHAARDFVFVAVDKKPMPECPEYHRVELFRYVEPDIEAALRIRDELLIEWRQIQDGTWKPTRQHAHRLWVPQAQEKEYGDAQ